MLLQLSEEDLRGLEQLKRELLYRLDDNSVIVDQQVIIDQPWAKHDIAYIMSGNIV